MGITTVGKGEVTGLVGNVDSKTAFSAIEYGTGTTAFAASQTALVTASQRSAATVTRATTTTEYDTLQLSYAFSITGTETITEVGVFNNATSGGTMLARTVLSS